jgi:hypothetical protein
MNDFLTKAIGEMSTIKSEVSTINGKLMSMEQLVQALKDTPAARAHLLLSRLRQLLADGTKNPSEYQSATGWAEVEDLVEDLRPVKDHLRDGLFRQVMSWLKDSRQRLQQNNSDAYAINQLRSVEKTLSNAAAG